MSIWMWWYEWEDKYGEPQVSEREYFRDFNKMKEHSAEHSECFGGSVCGYSSDYRKIEVG